MYKIFVGNLSINTNAEAIHRLFSRHALVDDVALPIDEQSGKPRGFAIVMIKDERQGRQAMLALRGTRLEGRTLIINEARKKGAKARARQQAGGFRGRAGRGFSANPVFGRRFGRRPNRALGRRPGLDRPQDSTGGTSSPGNPS